MNPKLQLTLGIGLALINIYDLTQVGFELKHGIFLGIASLAILTALGKIK